MLQRATCPAASGVEWRDRACGYKKQGFLLVIWHGTEEFWKHWSCILIHPRPIKSLAMSSCETVWRFPSLVCNKINELQALNELLVDHYILCKYWKKNQQINTMDASLKKNQHWWIATGTEAAVRFLFEEMLQMSSNKVCLTICNTRQCETPLKDSSVRAHLFARGRSNWEGGSSGRRQRTRIGKSRLCRAGLGGLARIRGPGSCVPVIQSSS